MTESLIITVPIVGLVLLMLLIAFWPIALVDVIVWTVAAILVGRYLRKDAAIGLRQATA